MGTAFQYAAIFHVDDTVAVLHHTQSMCNHQKSTSGRNLLEILAQQLFRLCIKRTCRLIKNQDLRISDKRPGNRNTLLLPSGKSIAAFRY